MFAALLPLPAQTADHLRNEFDPATQFIFYSVLEGCYEDGVSNGDIDQILLKGPNHWTRVHFIYACPVCMATVWALEAYRSRPEVFFSLKEGHSATFGSGLTSIQHQQLFSGDPRQRLAVINALVKEWIARRMDAQHLSATDRTALLAKLDEKRQQGMDVLKSFRHDKPGPDNSMTIYAPAYLDLDECAVCNGAVGKPMKMPDSAPKPAAKDGTP